MTQLLNVSVSDGKYTVIQEADGRLHALRYGEPFNRIVGDKLVLCLAQELAEAREDLTDAKELIDSLEQALASAQKCIDPTGHAPGTYTDPGPLTAADLSVARWPTLRDAKGKTFAERKAERTALLDQAKPATLEQAAEDAARMHSQMEADGTLRRAPLLDADFASLEARILASYHAAYPSLRPAIEAIRDTAKLSEEQLQQALQRAAAEHLQGQAPEAGMRLLKPGELVATTPNRTETTADFARRLGPVLTQTGWRWVETDHANGDTRVLRDEPCEAPASDRTAPNFHAQADSLASIPPGTPLFDPDKAVATFRKEIDMAVGTLLAKLNTKA